MTAIYFSSKPQFLSSMIKSSATQVTVFDFYHPLVLVWCCSLGDRNSM